MAIAFQCIIKAAWPKVQDKSERSALVHGYAVVLLTNTPGTAIEKDSSNVYPAERHITLYLHIGLAFLSPFRLTFQHLVREPKNADC